MMYIAMSYDHRIIDGTEAVTFLKTIKECVEAPERMLLEPSRISARPRRSDVQRCWNATPTTMRWFDRPLWVILDRGLLVLPDLERRLRLRRTGG